MKTLSDRADYLFKSAVDWFFKRSPVVFFVGGALSVAGAVLSGGISLDVTGGAIKFQYSNEITVFSCVLVLACLSSAYGAVKMQMKERTNTLTKEIQKLQHEHEKELEALKLKLLNEQQKSANAHANNGAVSNSLLQKITRLEGLFAGYIGAGSVQTNMIDGVKIDVYIANVINDQHKFKHLLSSDPDLQAAWTRMLTYLAEAQGAISRSFAGEKLDTVPLANAALYINPAIK